MATTPAAVVDHGHGAFLDAEGLAVLAQVWKSTDSSASCWRPMSIVVRATKVRWGRIGAIRWISSKAKSRK